MSIHAPSRLCPRHIEARPCAPGSERCHACTAELHRSLDLLLGDTDRMPLLAPEPGAEPLRSDP